MLVPGAFEDDILGLKLRGYTIVPNAALETKIAIYTREIVESILMDHPEVVDRWLAKLHTEYIRNKKSCDFENDPVACFTLSVYEQFEKHYKSWQDGGMIAISLPGERMIRVTKSPLYTIESGSGTLVCGVCSATFATLDAYDAHRAQEDLARQEKKKPAKDPYVAPDPIRWVIP
jgi:hypothetical protein